MYGGNGMGGWGMLFMSASGLLFWGLVIAGIVVLARSKGRVGPPNVSGGQAPAPQQVLADRFARGEIDDEEYTRRLQKLCAASGSRGPGA